MVFAFNLSNLEVTLKVWFTVERSDVTQKDLDIEGHEIVEDIAADWSSGTEEAVGVTKTKLLFHLRKVIK